MPPEALAGAFVIARPCIAAPVFLTEKVTLPAATVVLSALTHISPSVALTSAAGACPPCSCSAPALAGGTTFGAPAGVQDAHGALAMSPNEWVTKG